MLDPAPAEDAVPPTAPSPSAEPAVEPPVGAPAAPAPLRTHGGLADVDPWAERLAPAPARGVIWPFRLETLAETLEVIALALMMFMAVRFVAQNFIVDGASMEPTFNHGDLVIVNKLAYRTFDISWLPWSDNDDWRPFGNPSPGDVVVFRFPQNPGRDFIKRVIAGPGQTVEVRDGLLLIDGVEVVEPFIAEAPGYAFGPETVPEDKLFVLGDNRNNSFDSHSWGMLDRDEMIGRAELRYWPPKDLGLIGHTAGSSVAAGQPAIRSGAPVSP